MKINEYELTDQQTETLLQLKRTLSLVLDHSYGIPQNLVAEAIVDKYRDGTPDLQVSIETAYDERKKEFENPF